MMNLNNIKKFLVFPLIIFILLNVIFRTSPTFTHAQTPTPNLNNIWIDFWGNVYDILHPKTHTSTDPTEITPIPGNVHDPNVTTDPSNPGLPEDLNITIGPIPPANASKLTKILYWTSVLNAKLIPENKVWPPWYYYHKMVDPVSNGGYRGIAGNATDLTNLYWCTFLVIDAFNLSGISGLTTAHSAVLNMIPVFMNTPGYMFIPYSVVFSTYSPPRYRITTIIERKQALRTVQPGCTTFFQSRPGIHERNHVAIIKTKSLDSNYYGYIETYDSNNTSRTVRYPVKAGNIENTLYVPDSLRGFGCPT